MTTSAFSGPLLGVMIVLAAWVPIGAQEANPPKSPEAAAPKLNGDVAQKTLRELEARRAKAWSELQVLEAQLAVKRAEAQMIDVEVLLLLTQQPDLIDQRNLPNALKFDPEVASLLLQIERVKNRWKSIARMVHSHGDPAMVAAESELRSLKDKLRELVLQKASIRSPSKPPASASDEVEHKLDVIIRELESVRRVLLREPHKP